MCVTTLLCLSNCQMNERHQDDKEKIQSVLYRNYLRTSKANEFIPMVEIINWGHHVTLSVDTNFTFGTLNEIHSFLSVLLFTYIASSRNFGMIHVSGR